MSGKEQTKNVRCSFCGKTQEVVQRIIAGPGVYICDECIKVCTNIIEDDLYEDPEITYTLNENDKLPTPAEIKNHKTFIQTTFIFLFHFFILPNIIIYFFYFYYIYLIYLLFKKSSIYSAPFTQYYIIINNLMDFDVNHFSLLQNVNVVLLNSLLNQQLL